MNIIILGAAGFIGTNLAIKLKEDKNNRITLVDKRIDYFASNVKAENVNLISSSLDCDDKFDYLKDQEVVYHLVSTTSPTTSNQHIPTELQDNVVFSSLLFEACVKYCVKKIVFISSGGTVYGKESNCPISEDTLLKPISSYGLQKVAIENLLYLYNHMFGLDYRIIRLSNPYGPYQRPNGMLGVISTFTYHALRTEPIRVYGDGSIVRDFIYIDDAIRGIRNIVDGNGTKRTYNLGSGKGTSIREIVETVESVIGKVDVEYLAARNVDVPLNYLDISKYERDYGALNPISLEEGICKTADFMRSYYNL